jgi:hypothetical protein
MEIAECPLLASQYLTYENYFKCGRNNGKEHEYTI